MRFSEFQEHLGKLLRAIAQEEEVEITGFSDVLAFAEKAEILANTEDWKKARDVRNQINHEYEENERVLAPLIAEMASCIPTLFLINVRATAYCADRFGIEKPWLAKAQTL